MICWRSVAYSIASLTSGLSSSRCVVFFGLPLMMNVFMEMDGGVDTTRPACFKVATAVGGVYSPMKSTCPVLSAWIIASSFEKNCRPKPSICGFGPYHAGFRLNSATWFFTYFTSSNGPPETSGWPLRGVFWNVLIPVPLPVKYCAHTWRGRMDIPWNCESTLATGFL